TGPGARARAARRPRAATGTRRPAAEAGAAARLGRGGARVRAARPPCGRRGTPLAALPTVAGVRVAFDEMLEGDLVRPPWRAVHDWLAKASPGELERRRREAELRFRRLGITFSVGSEGGDSDRLIPFDVVPRLLSAADWRRLPPP